MITGVDFVSVATSDFERALDFYGNVLGLEHTVTYGRSPGAEFETGSLTLQILESEGFGMTFQTDNHPIAFKVDDVAAARPSSSRAASCSRATRSTRASATWRSSRTPTATRSCSTTATRRRRRPGEPMTSPARPGRYQYDPEARKEMER